MSEPQYNFALKTVLFTQFINAELFSAVSLKQFRDGDLVYQPESGMPLNVKDGVVLWVIEDESDLPWFVFIGFFDICQYLSENVRRKRVKTVDSGNLIRNDKILCPTVNKRQTFPVNSPVLAQIMKRLPVKGLGQFDADGTVVKTVVCVKTQTAQAAAVIQQGILIRQGNGFKQSMQHAVGSWFVAVAVKSVPAVGLNLLCVYV